MANVNAVLNEQIRRISRREISGGVKGMRKAAGKHRRDIAALKRLVGALAREVAGLRKKMPAENVKEDGRRGARLRMDGLRGHRMRLGLSAKEYGKLFGVSELTIYNWENGKSKPQRSLVPRILATRGIGKREALERLGLKGKSMRRGRYNRTGEETLLHLLKGKGALTREVNKAWRAEKRAGSANVLLGKLVKSGQLVRMKVKGERGSKYALA